jgi:predicted anti-sigma-YlaC factor YlaD
MTHLDEEQLILAHYGEPHDPELDAHLKECERCRKEAAALAVALDAIDDPGPELPSEYDARTWNRLRWQLSPQRSRFDRRWLAAAAALVLVCIGFIAGRMFRTEAPAPTASGRPPMGDRRADADRDAAVASAVTEQVGRSERLLVELSNLGPGDSDLTAESLAAERLLVSNRIHRAVARESGAPEIAALLADIEPILLEISHSGNEISASELAAIQRRIEAHGLIFKLRVLSSSLESKSNNQRPPAPPSTRL